MNQSFRAEELKNSNFIVVSAGAPPIRTPSRLGKREDQFDFLEPKFDEPNKLKWKQSHWKKNY